MCRWYWKLSKNIVKPRQSWISKVDFDLLRTLVVTLVVSVPCQGTFGQSMKAWRRISMKAYIYEGVYLWRRISMKAYIYEGVYLWRRISMKACIYEGVFLWRRISMKAYIYESVYLWRRISMKAYFYEGVYLWRRICTNNIFGLRLIWHIWLAFLP